MDLVDQHPIWQHMDGYYMGDCYDHQGLEDLPTVPSQIDAEPTVAFPGWPYPEVSSTLSIMASLRCMNGLPHFMFTRIQPLSLVSLCG